MKEKVSRKFWSKLVAGFFAIALMMIGVLFVGNGSSEVFASGTMKDISVREVPDISEYRTEDGYTYPKPIEEGKTDYIFAGWYADSACTEVFTTSTIEGVTKAYAKYVPAETMDVKFQVLAGTNVASEKTDLRMVSTVDSTNYQKVGYSIIANGKELLTDTQSVFKRIKSNTEGLEYGYSPVVFDTDSEYFVTFTIKNIKNKNFDRTYNVRPYWVTMDGTTVYGCGRNVKVSDSYNGIANVPVRIYADNVAAGSDITVTYESADFTYLEGKHEVGNVDAGVTVTNNGVAEDGTGSITCTTSQAVTDANGMLVNLRFQINSTASSNEVFEMTGTGASDYLYRVFSTSYQGEPDTSWYDGFETENTFVITTPADLYGFASIVNAGTDTFKDNTVYLGADITVNKGQATTDGWITTKDVNGNEITDGSGTEHKWIPIGYTATAAKRFQGTFDGCGNTIEGIYMIDNYENRTSSDEHYSGLFGITVAGSTIRNFKLTNSYFECSTGSTTSYAFMGSVVGQLAGNIDTVYSDAIVKSIYMAVGGIAGRVNPGAAPAKSEIKNCWFAGSINVTQAKVVNFGVGGILGVSLQGGSNIIDCLNTADITYIAETRGNSAFLNIGGIKGSGGDTMTNCINAGTVSGTIENGAVKPNRVVSISATGTQEYCIDASGTNTTTYNGYKGYIAMKDTFNFYDWGKDTGLEGANPGNWVCRATADSAIDGIPVLKSFCDEWIDVSWYYDDTEATEFTISHAEELYGWSEISNVPAKVYNETPVNFSKDVTIKLGGDIKMNNGMASKWVSDVNNEIYRRDFMPINGSATTKTAADGKVTITQQVFAGKFDGNGFEISGLYISKDSANLNGYGTGLFGYANNHIQNVSLTNSFIDSGKTFTGSIVGFYSSQMTNVYSDAYVKSSKAETGGLVGRYGGNSDGNGIQKVSITNSWFAGTVSANNDTGGIAGKIERGKDVKTLQNCLNTGAISGWARIGGLIGSTNSANLHSQKVSNCLSTGTITANSGPGGAILGLTSVPFIFENVYTTQTTGGQITGVGNTEVATTITGEPILLTQANLTGKDAYIYTDLGFYDTNATDNVWGIVKDGTPVINKLYDGVVETGLSGQRVSTNWYYNAKVRNKATGLDNVATDYSISDSGDMFGLASIVNGNKDLFANKKIYLEADVDLSQKEWTPIGNATYKFAGTFDGQKTDTDEIHTISGLWSNQVATNRGLFGYTAAGSWVKDFRLTESTIKQAKGNSGSVIGCMEGNIQNVYSNATVEATGAHVGGIVGNIYAATNSQEIAVTECWFDGTVKSSSDYHGGVVGRVYRGIVTMSNCLNTGKVINTCLWPEGVAQTYAGAGGLVGYVRGDTDTTTHPSFTMRNCLNTGTVKAVAQNCVGSVIGRTLRAQRITIENVYTTDKLENIAKQEGKSEQDESFSTSNSRNGIGSLSTNQVSMDGLPVILENTDIEDKQAYYNTELSFFSNNDESGIWVAINGKSPELKKLSKNVVINDFGSKARKSTGWYYNNTKWNASKPLVNAQNNYTISDVADFYGFAELVNRGVESFSGKTVSLAANINLNGDVTDQIVETWVAGTEPTNSWTPIGTTTNPFKGTFNGASKTISGLYVKRESSDIGNVGLFGVATNPIIKNVRLVNSYLSFKSAGTNKYAQMGAIVGTINGDGNGTLDNIYTKATLVSNERRVGGFVGYVERTGAADTTSLNITNGWFDGKIIVDSQNLYAGGMYAGGLVGYAYKGTTNLDTCLYSGIMECIYKANTKQGTSVHSIAGLVGSDGSAGMVTIEDSIAAGTIHLDWKKFSDESSVTSHNICDIIGTVNKGSSTRTEGTVLALVDITRTSEASGKTDEITSTYNTYKREENLNVANFSNISNTWDDAVGAEPSKEPTIYNLGAYMYTTLAFEKTADDDTTIWLSRQSSLPIPTTMADVVKDEMPLAEYVNTRWYTGETTEYEISDAKDLYGLAKLSYTNSFEGDTIKLAKNITVNEGDASEWKDTPPVLQWYPIGKDGTFKFQGKFDGQGNTIDGLYSKMHCSDVGLFGVTGTKSFVCNLRIENSYISEANSEKHCYVGSIAGKAQGEFDNIYSNAYIVSAHEETGGIISRITTDKSETEETDGYAHVYTNTNGKNFVYKTKPSMTNCWFDGVIDIGNGRYAGGIVGVVFQGGLDMSNCLFTGTIKTNHTNAEKNTNVGGVIGSINAQPGQYVTLDSIVSAGKIVGDHHHKGVGSVVGAAQAGFFGQDTDYVIPVGAMLTMTNVFATRDCYSIPVNTTGGSYKKEGTEETITSTASVTGTVVNTTGDDRLLGLIPHEVNYDNNDSSVMKLTFANDGWVMRRDSAPIPAAFIDIVTTEIALPIDSSAMAQEIGLNYWNTEAKIADAISYGAGNYVVSYENVTKDKYDNYIDMLGTLVGETATNGMQGLGFTSHIDNLSSDMASDDDQVYASTYYKNATDTTGEWVLNLTFVGRESKIYISINTDTNSLAKMLKNNADDNPLAYAGGTEDVSLSMLEMLIGDRNGNGFVFQLPNGHFIVNDGGSIKEAQLLVEYLKHLAGKTDGQQNPVYIDAWIATHYHNDHTGILREIATNPSLREGIYVNAFYSSEPTTLSQIVLYDTGEVYENLISQINQEIKGIRAFTKSDTDSSAPELYRLHMGQRYYFNGITMDVVDTQEQHHRDTWDDEKDPDLFNTTSTTCVYTVNATGQKILLGGDANNVNMEYMMTVYGKESNGGGSSQTLSNIDVVVAYHHGRNAICDYEPGETGLFAYNYAGTANNTWADYLLNNANNSSGFRFDTVLFPYYKVFEYYKRDQWNDRNTIYVGDDDSIVYPYNIGKINQYLIDHAESYYTYGYDDIVNGVETTQENPHGTVQLIFRADGTISPVIYKSLYGTITEENPNYAIEIMWRKEEE